MLALIALLTKLVIFDLAFHATTSKAECPDALPIEVGEQCFRFVGQNRNFKDADSNCRNVHPGAGLVTVKTQEELDRIQQEVVSYVRDSTDGIIYFIGLYTKDDDVMKAAENRVWKWHYDDEEFVQKDFDFWYQDKGPTDKTKVCGAIDPAEDYKVIGGNCNAEYPAVCVAKKGSSCSGNYASYSYYSEWCVGVLKNRYKYRDIYQACEPHIPASMKEEYRADVLKAVKNYMLGGGVYVNVKRSDDDTFKDVSDGTEPNADWWEDKEPRGESDCLVLALQDDSSLKWKTINCSNYAASLCGYQKGEGEAP